MHRLQIARVAVALLFCFALLSGAGEGKLDYVKKSTRTATILASLRASGLPNLEGTWQWIGPFDNPSEDAFHLSYPPEKEIDLTKNYAGKRGLVSWHKFDGFALGKVVNLAVYEPHNNTFIYLYHEFTSPKEMTLPVSLGSDDSIAIWLNGKKVLENNALRAAEADQDEVDLKLQAGKNQLLVRVGNLDGEFAVYVCPQFPDFFEAKFPRRLVKDFPEHAPSGSATLLQAEARHYRIVTLPLPKEIVLEVGGLAFRGDTLLACTRRGEIWAISRPDWEDPRQVEYKLLAGGLHEALGLHVEGKDVYVVQRPELTKLVDRDGDGAADHFQTICDKWGVSGDYHEFAFGPARDKEGNFFVTLNVGFGGGHQSKSPWRGWCVKITPTGELIPWATGLRSPNGVNFSPDGDLFYCDNQGEWVATNKMHHIRPGEFYGHQAGLRWVSQSPFVKTLSPKHPYGMLMDGQSGPSGVSGMPTFTPPCIWFPYGRMGQSAAEPRWDTTGGKFGPFAGQCFVGDQTRSNILRVALEKVNGKYQGACFPFRNGFQCGINRLVFGPDGSLYAGQTNRGWGSVGGKPYGLQRLVYTGIVPMEVLTMKLTKAGFDLTFTKPVDRASARQMAAYSLQSFTYNYWQTYGSPEEDRKAEKIESVQIASDGRTVSLTAGGLRRGRVYELHLNGLRSTDGDAVLHPEAYYTLNELP